MHLGLRGARSTLSVLLKALGLTYDLKELEDEIKAQEADDEEMTTRQRSKLDTINKLKRYKDTNYIG